MASKGQLESWTEEAICPVCLDFFTDPVILDCGHNFCRSCITRCWEREERNSCPECREVFEDPTLRVNRALASLSEKARKLNLNPIKRESKLHCEEHQEELKLFCETDQKLICVICRDAREHKVHSFLPIKEAVEIYKDQIKSSIESLTKMKSDIQEIEQQQKEKISGVREQSHSLQSHITSQFAELHQILTEKEQSLLRDLREEEKKILNPMERNLQKIQENLNSIQEKLTKLQERMNEEDNVIFLKEEARRKRRISDVTQKLPVTDGALPVEKFDHPFLLNPALREMFDTIKRDTPYYGGIICKHEDGIRAESGQAVMNILGVEKRAEDAAFWSTSVKNNSAGGVADDPHIAVCWSLHNAEEEVLEVFKCRKVDKYPKPDQVYPRTWWGALEEIVGFLVKIFVSSISTGEVPEDWRVTHVGPLLKKGCKVNSVSVTLDVETASPRLEVSEDRKSVRRTRTRKDLPDTGKRFTVWECVLGSEGFTSGRHYWEVEVARSRSWSLGVAAECVERKGWVGLIPESGFWTIGRWADEFYVNTSPGSRLPAGPIPGRVGVYLSYESGTVSFYSADTKSHLHTFTGNKFTEKLYPFFGTWDGNQWLRICSCSAPDL
ncbi:E3 ubiquitin-protein ligase TRIM39-like [Pristis pectinata]|uniref:E3 ubiquitin-protein ligase TRIM39-like n=1 Tax=Pristis pectinata TaxID=685728 RepID=UPI00223E0CBF|nr:E3 ubiquitin-protein ligase TRIM39-like [Pristis pectinata]